MYWINPTTAIDKKNYIIISKSAISKQIFFFPFVSNIIEQQQKYRFPLPTTIFNLCSSFLVYNFSKSNTIVLPLSILNHTLWKSWLYSNTYLNKWHLQYNSCVLIDGLITSQFINSVMFDNCMVKLFLFCINTQIAER